MTSRTLPGMRSYRRGLGDMVAHVSGLAFVGHRPSSLVSSLRPFDLFAENRDSVGSFGNVRKVFGEIRNV